MRKNRELKSRGSEKRHCRLRAFFELYGNGDAANRYQLQRAGPLLREIITMVLPGTQSVLRLPETLNCSFKSCLV